MRLSRAEAPRVRLSAVHKIKRSRNCSRWRNELTVAAQPRAGTALLRPISKNTVSLSKRRWRAPCQHVRHRSERAIVGEAPRATTADGMTILRNAGLALMPMIVRAIAFSALLAPYAADARIPRDRSEVRAFRTHNACPSTGLVRGACPGHHVDHVIPLCAGGADHRSNMQWITREDHRFKTLVDVRECRRQRARNHLHASGSPGEPRTPDPSPHGVPARGSVPPP